MIIETIKQKDKVVDRRLVKVEKKDLIDGYKLKIPYGITIIGSFAFSNFDIDQKLKIKMPDTVTTIEEYAFSRLRIEKINLSQKLAKIGKRTFCDSEIDRIEIPPSVLIIDKQAFTYSKLNEVKFNEGLLMIGEGAFEYTIGLTDIDFPESLQYIGRSAFFASSGLLSVKFPSNLRYIDSEAFACCDLDKVSIPDSVEFGSYVFSGTCDLTEINMSEEQFDKLCKNSKNIFAGIDKNVKISLNNSNRSTRKVNYQKRKIMKYKN